jgi:nucleotide-binding universal stress UspA family protein
MKEDDVAGLIVVGIDGSAAARHALVWALEETRIREASLRVVMAWSYLDKLEDHFDPRRGEDAARGRLKEAVKAVTAGASDVPIEPMLVNDLPARALLGAAAGADLLVVGARGLGGIRGVLLGSVSQQVAQHAPCPVVIVPDEARGRDSD